MTINSPAAILLAFYVCVGEEQGVPRDKLRGTAQTDILKEYIAQKEWIFPPEPSMRLVTDMIEFCAREMPLFHPVSISGYHIREAGSTAAQELAFTLADGFAYVESAIERGLDVDDFAPRLSFFFNAHIDFFEEIAKYRAARRIWARELRERFGATQRALAADALPRADRRRLADGAAAGGQHRADGARGARGRARRHAEPAHELLRRGARAPDRGRRADRAAHAAGHRARVGCGHTIDPLGGSYYVESLTNALEAQAYEYFDRIDELGGVVPAIKENFFQREIAEASFRFQSEVESREARRSSASTATSRGRGADRDPQDRPGARAEADRPARAVKASRDSAKVEAGLAALKEAARRRTASTSCRRSSTPSRDYVTLGEMCDALREVWGVWRETPVF